MPDPALFARTGEAIEAFEQGLDALRAGLEAQGLIGRLQLYLAVRGISARLRRELAERLEL